MNCPQILERVPEWIVHMWSEQNSLSSPETRNTTSIAAKTYIYNFKDNQNGRGKENFNWTDKEIQLLLESIKTFRFFFKFFVVFFSTFLSRTKLLGFVSWTAQERCESEASPQQNSLR